MADYKQMLQLFQRREDKLKELTQVNQDLSLALKSTSFEKKKIAKLIKEQGVKYKEQVTKLEAGVLELNETIELLNERVKEESRTYKEKRQIDTMMNEGGDKENKTKSQKKQSLNKEITDTQSGTKRSVEQETEFQLFISPAPGVESHANDNNQEEELDLDKIEKELAMIDNREIDNDPLESEDLTENDGELLEQLTTKQKMDVLDVGMQQKKNQKMMENQYVEQGFKIGNVSQKMKFPKITSNRRYTQDSIRRLLSTSIQRGISCHSRRNIKYDEPDSGDSSGEDEDNDWVKDSMQYLNTEGFETKVKPNERFKNYKDVFNNLVVSTNVKTKFPIVSAAIAFDSKAVITVTKSSEREYWVKMYSLKTNKQIFVEKFGGGTKQYIKMKEISQNAEGIKYAMVYFDDGRFLLRTFARQEGTEEQIKENEVYERTEEQIKKNEVCFNDLLKINADTMPIQNFPDPYITTCFVTDNLLFVQLYHGPTLTHYHLFWDIEKHAIVGEPFSCVMLAEDGCTPKNFPYKCFYNDEDEEVYAFYRQGEFFNVPIPGRQLKMKSNLENEVQSGDCTDMSLGDMYLVFNKLIVARSSQEIVFLKLGQDENDPHPVWKQFHSLPHKGFLFFIKGNIRIQITTDDKIYFYLIDPLTLVPNLENVMYNYMNCNQTMFGKRVRFCVTYTTNTKSFDVFRRKYQQNYKVPVSLQNLEGAALLELEKQNRFIVTMRDKVTFYDISTFKEVDSLPIKLFKSETREITQVMAIQKCQNEEYLAVISGKKFIKERNLPFQLFIFRKISGGTKYEQKFRVVTRDIEIFKKVCMSFHFVQEDGLERHKILFSKNDCIFSLDFTNEKVDIVYKYKQEMSNQPSHFETDDSTTLFCVANKQQSIVIDKNKNEEMSINEEYNLELYNSVKYDLESNSLYIIANRLDTQLGFYILNISIEDPMPGGYNSFILKQKHSLEIGDCAINILRDPKTLFKEIVISYKTIQINTYSIMVIDQNHESGQPLMYRHESFQLWESQCNGTLLHGTNDFIAVNKDGINVFALGSVQKRVIEDVNGDLRILNSLESMNYLKLDPTNVLVFANQNMEKREVQVYQVIQDPDKGYEIEYHDLYKVKINTITLRELLLFQSIYVCVSQKAIVDLVRDQPQPTVFYKTFLELNGANMCSILSFDSRSMSFLLSDNFDNLFQAKYPIFYKNKVDKGKSHKQKYCYRNALDTAVNSDQNRACERIITYLCKYQNNFISHYLFMNCFHTIIDKGINITDLLKSRILNYQFEFDQWPSQHTDDLTYMRPYNGSIFDLQFAYSKLFHEKGFEDVIANIQNDFKQTSGIDSSKVFKIQYTINLIPSYGQHVENKQNSKEEHLHLNKNILLMELLSKTEEYSIFNTDAMQYYIDFKWEKVGKNHHAFGAILHYVYLLYFCMYVNDVYIDANYQFIKEKDESALNSESLVFIVGVLYPLGYEVMQLYQTGFRKYIYNIQNIQDIIFVATGIANGIVHYTYSPYTVPAKMLTIANLIFSVQRTLEKLRILKTFSPIVIMLFGVLGEFSDFLLFQFLLISFMSMGFSVIQINDPRLSLEFQQVIEESGGKQYPGSEYQHIWVALRSWITMLRITTGDFNIMGSLNFLPSPINELFLAFWIICILISTIIFINFVITKATFAYIKVSERMNELTYLNKAHMIAEADDVKFIWMKNEHNYPKYFVVRKVQN